MNDIVNGSDIDEIVSTLTGKVLLCNWLRSAGVPPESSGSMAVNNGLCSRLPRSKLKSASFFRPPSWKPKSWAKALLLSSRLPLSPLSSSLLSLLLMLLRLEVMASNWEPHHSLSSLFCFADVFHLAHRRKSDTPPQHFCFWNENSFTSMLTLVVVGSGAYTFLHLLPSWAFRGGQKQCKSSAAVVTCFQQANIYAVARSSSHLFWFPGYTSVNFWSESFWKHLFCLQTVHKLEHDMYAVL